MIPFLILILAALSRLLPHFAHAGYNFTAVGAGLLFFGSRRPRWQAVMAVAVMGLMDVFLTVKMYHYPFHVRGYLPTWAWYVAVCLMGSALLRKVSAVRVVAGAFASATSFFLLSNFVVWMGTMYDHSLFGLAQCYAAGLPFYGPDLLSTGLWCGVLFGLPVVVRHLAAEQGSAGVLD
jgi:hypothetical protein